MWSKNADQERLRFDIVAHTIMVHPNRRRLGGGAVTVAGRSEVIETTLQCRLEVGPGPLSVSVQLLPGGKKLLKLTVCTLEWSD
jgi:hypothetical protein